MVCVSVGGNGLRLVLGKDGPGWNVKWGKFLGLFNSIFRVIRVKAPRVLCCGKHQQNLF